MLRAGLAAHPVDPNWSLELVWCLCRDIERAAELRVDVLSLLVALMLSSVGPFVDWAK